MKERGESVSAEAGHPQKALHEVTLSDLGITRLQSHRWQKLADVPKDKFGENPLH
jgi:hypothetical protein